MEALILDHTVLRDAYPDIITTLYDNVPYWKVHLGGVYNFGLLVETTADQRGCHVCARGLDKHLRAVARPVRNPAVTPTSTGRERNDLAPGKGTGCVCESEPG